MTDERESPSHQASDLTDLRMRLTRAEQWEALCLAGGRLAHQLGNVVQPIAWSSSVLSESIDPSQSLVSNEVQRLEKAASHAQAIVTDLSALAAPPAGPRERLNLGTLTEAFLASDFAMGLRIANPSVSVHQSIEREEGHIMGSELSVMFILKVLLGNAYQASEENDGIEVDVRFLNLSEPSYGYEIVPAGDYVCLAVCSSGCDMFMDPLWETLCPIKSKRGSLLGIPVIYSLLRDHGGYLDVSAKEESAGLVLYFPRNLDDRPSEAPRRKKILIVSDAVGHADALGKTLLEKGFQVFLALCGSDVRGKSRAYAPDLIVVDTTVRDGLARDLTSLLQESADASNCLAVGTTPNPLLDQIEHHLCVPWDEYLTIIYQIKTLAC